MVIIHSDREGLTNFDNVQMVHLMGRYIHVSLNDGTTKTIAVYSDVDRAAEVFSNMLSELFPDPDNDEDFDKMMPFINASGAFDDLDECDISVFPSFVPQWYYMPKE